MDKYLLEILKNVNTIIIPGLGALTITDHDTGEIMFMSYLKHDDGKLVEYIVENEGFEELEAKNLIAKYVREIQLTLDKGESYDMYQFGSFIKNGDDIDFKNWDKNAPATSKPEEKTVETPVVATEAQITEEQTEELVVEEEIVSLVTETPIEETAKKEKTKPVVVHLKEEEAPTKEMNILEKEEKAATAAKLEKLRKEKEEPVEKNKKGIGFWMLMTLIILILAGGTYFGLNYNELKQHIPFLADKEDPIVQVSDQDDNESNNYESDELADIDNTEEDIQPKEDTVTEEEIEAIEEVEIKEIPNDQPFVSSSNNLPFHVIAGAFSSEENANRLGEKFRSEGFNVKVGPGRGLTLVSIKSFATRAEAQSAISGLSTSAPNAWVYKWK